MGKKRRYSEPELRRINGRTKRKLAGLFTAVVLALICLIGRITYINAKSGDQYARQVLAQSQSEYGSTILPFKRGDILDRNGAVLATSEKKYNVILDCRVVNSSEKYADPTVESLVTVFDLSEETIRELLTSEETMDSQYQVIMRDVTIEGKRAFEEYKNGTDERPLSEELQKERNLIQGVWFEEDYDRIYPFGTLACDVIGFTNGDDSADWGIEGYYCNTLNGVDGRRYGYWTDNQEVEQNIVNPVDGNNVVTTIDANIQAIVEEEIAAFHERYCTGPYSDTKGAENIGIIVMDPNTFEIYAMASSDPFDLNDPRDLTRFFTAEEIDAMSSTTQINELQAIWRNYCIADTYEPGSVFKPVTMSSALMDGSIKETDMFYCDGGEEVAGTYIRCSQNDGHGEETVLDVIRNSCNDGIMQIVRKMGVDEFCRYQRVFNFGSRTNIDLPGEAAGILYQPDAMGDVDLATSAFGQSFTCTMIQEAAAFCSVVNGGYYYQPRVVRKVTNSEGSAVKAYEPVLLKQTVSADISAQMRTYLTASVENGTSAYAKINGYTMGGKTGTAQKLPRGNGKYLVSWIGMLPAEQPELVIYVVIDEPNVEMQADSRYPQWLAKRVLERILPYMNLFPDEPYRQIDPMYLEPSSGEEVTPEIVSDVATDPNLPIPADEPSTEEPASIGEEANGFTDEEAGLTDGE